MKLAGLASTKSSAPAAERVYLRTRLFKQLDRAFRHHSLVWINAPGGYGKTLLAASYLKARQHSHLWYQVDVSDNDPASFFHNLGFGAQRLAPRRRPLPALTPEYYAGLPTFTRNYFRELSSRLKQPGFIVFDNLHELPPDSPLHNLLESAFSELPKDVRVLLLSRAAPPPVFARMQAHNILVEIDASDLALTLEESRGIGRLHAGQKLDTATLEELYNKSRGWAAGFMLLLQRPHSHTAVTASGARMTPQTISDYFTNEVLERAPADVQGFLLKTALLPSIRPDVAQAMTGHPDAAKLLSDLARRNYFLTAHHERKPVYQYHPLFEEFLRVEAQRRLGAEKIRSLRALASGLLHDVGDVEIAVELSLQAGDAEKAAALILAHAESMLRQGRFELLRQWMECLPAERRDCDPWLLYWYASALTAQDMRAALAGYARSYALFRKQGKDVAGMYLSLITLIDSYLRAWHEFISLDQWFNELEALRREFPKIPSPDLANYVTSATLGAYMMRRPQDSRLRQWLGDADALFQKIDEPGQKLNLARNLLFVHSWLGNLARSELLLNATREIVSHPATHPVDRMFFCVYDAVQGWHTSNSQRWRLAVERGLKVMRDSGVLVTFANMIGQGVYGALSDHDLATANQYLARMREASNFSRHMDAAHYYYVASWDALQRQSWLEARQLGELGLQNILAAGIVFPEGLIRNLLAYALFECGEPQAAREQLLQAQKMGDAIGTPILQIQTACAEAGFLVREDKEVEALALLRRALVLMRESGLPNFAGWLHREMSMLCALALEHDIETKLVRQLIVRRLLRPPQDRPASDAWPFPLKIYTLGRFAILRDDQPVRFEGKAQKKPLELLKLLIALGGRDVAETRLLDALWPDADAGQARQNLKAAVHRLRKLIGENVLHLSEGKFTLDPQQAWVDVWSCERLLNESRDLLNTGRTGQAIKRGRRAIRLHQGPFLAADDQPYVMPMRERLRSKLLAQIGDLARLQCQTKACQESLVLYQMGLEIDPLTEPFYQGLMHCYQCLDQPAEAIKTFERCRSLLKSHLGIEPSRETRAMEQAIRASVQ